MKFIKYLNQVVPHDFIDSPPILVQKDHKTITLNKDYLCDLFNYIHMFHLNYFDKENQLDKPIPLSAKQLKKKYGGDYSFYIKYLMDVSYIRLIRNYTKGSHCTTYKFLYRKLDHIQLVNYKNRNKRMINNYKNLLNSNLESIIYAKRLINSVKSNLESVAIKKDEAIQYLDSLYPNQNCGKYFKNYISILNIEERDPYLISDEHGRIHTNFTVLKKEIRNQFLRIDSENIKEKDISNSQALFFLYLVSQNLNESIDQSELNEFKSLIHQGVFYDSLATHSGITRAVIKEQFFRYLFGGIKAKFVVFNQSFPSISKFIKKYKTQLGNYKLLSHELQLLEGDFIFNGICSELTKQKIKFFTIHDSVCVKTSDFDRMASIFENKLDRLKQEISMNIQSYFFINN